MAASAQVDAFSCSDSSTRLVKAQVLTHLLHRNVQRFRGGLVFKDSSTRLVKAQVHTRETGFFIDTLLVRIHSG